MQKKHIRLKFDRKWLKETISNLEYRLKNEALSSEDEIVIKNTISKLNLYKSIVRGKINTNVQDESSLISEPRKLLTLGDDVLEKLRQDFDSFEPELMDFIISLEHDRTLVAFNSKPFYKKQAIEQICEDTMYVYQKFLPTFAPLSNQIITSSIPLIHATEKQIYRSECFFSPYLKKPLIVAQDIYHSPTAFIHELQHGVDYIRNFPVNYFFQELAPILLEILYVDRLLETKSAKAERLYISRLEDSCASIGKLANYFRALKELEQYNFYVDKITLIDILEKYDLINEEYLYEDLTFLLQENFYEELCYLLSFLKGIQLRTSLYDNRKIGEKELLYYLREAEFDVGCLQKGCLEELGNYQEEIAKKLEESKHSGKLLYKIKKLVK